MEIGDQFSVHASGAQAWELFWDIPRLARCLPGCEAIEAVDDTHYTARVVQRVGPFQLAMDLDLTVDEVVPQQRVVVSGGGKDRLGNRMSLRRLALELRPVSDDETELSYSMDFHLFGRLATLGSAVVKRKAGEMRVEFTKRIIEELEGTGS